VIPAQGSADGRSKASGVLAVWACGRLPALQALVVLIEKPIIP